MPQLIWTGPALADAQRLYRFLASKSPDAARRALSAIRTQVRILETYPGLGRALAETDSGGIGDLCGDHWADGGIYGPDFFPGDGWAIFSTLSRGNRHCTISRQVPVASNSSPSRIKTRISC